MEKGLLVLAKQIGKDSLDAAPLAARLSSLRGGNSTAKMGRDLPIIYKEAQTQYDALAAAYAQKDWQSVNAHAHNLSGLFRRESLIVVDLESHRERLKAAGRLDQQAEYDLSRLKARKKEIETFFSAKPGSEEIHRLHARIEDLSDEIHHCMRDGKINDIQNLFPQLEKRWKMLQGQMNNGNKR